MDEVDTEVRARISRWLDRSLWEWSRLPEVEAEIEQWDQIDQIVYVTEWTLEEERLLRLERYRASGAMTSEQVAEHDKLRRLVAQNRPIIERLRRG